MTPEAERAARERLAYKYARLLELRQARARGEAIPARAVFRELAREFPGCLSELDTLSLAALELRASGTAAAVTAGAVGAPPPWIRWMTMFHALFRAALYLKPRVGRGADLDDARAAALAADASARSAIAVDAAFARAVAAPPDGRIARLVIGEVARRVGEADEVVKRALFPASRR